MTYYTGSATNHGDFFDKLRGHAENHGWTTSETSGVHFLLRDGVEHTYTTNLSGTGYVDLSASIESFGGGGYNVGTLAKRSSAMYLSKWRYTDSIPSYHVFITTSPSPIIHAAVEILPSIWRHMSFGIIDKKGSWEGGAFSIYSALPHTSQLLLAYSANHGAMGIGSGGVNISTLSATNDSSLLGWAGYATSLASVQNNFTTSGYDFGFALSIGASALLRTSQPNAGTGETILTPVKVYTPRDSNFGSLAGYITNVALVSSKAFSDAQNVVVGGDTWVVFPATANGFISDTGLIEESGNIGIAYKK